MINKTALPRPAPACRRSRGLRILLISKPTGAWRAVDWAFRASAPPAPDWLRLTTGSGSRLSIHSCCHRPGITSDKDTQKRSNECYVERRPAHRARKAPLSATLHPEQRSAEAFDPDKSVSGVASPYGWKGSTADRPAQRKQPRLAVHHLGPAQRGRDGRRRRPGIGCAGDRASDH